MAEMEGMIPLLSVSSIDFDKDLKIIRRVFEQLEKKTRFEDAFGFSPRAEMAAGWWFYDVFVTPDFLQRLLQLVLPPGFSHNKKSAAIKIVGMFQTRSKRTALKQGSRCMATYPLPPLAGMADELSLPGLFKKSEVERRNLELTILIERGQLTF